MIPDNYDKMTSGERNEWLAKEKERLQKDLINFKSRLDFIKRYL
jgi:hypothetical protein